MNRIRPLAAGGHVGRDVLGQVHGGAHVEVDDLELVGEVGVAGEGAAGAAPAFSAAAASGRPVARTRS